MRRRAAIIAFEAETNIIIHSLGGRITAAIDPDKVSIDATDEGPGIENVELAMQDGWSTAGPLARALGFGAGMGWMHGRKKLQRKHEETAAGLQARPRGGKVPPLKIPLAASPIVPSLSPRLGAACADAREG